MASGPETTGGRRETAAGKAAAKTPRPRAKVTDELAKRRDDALGIRDAGRVLSKTIATTDEEGLSEGLVDLLREVATMALAAVRERTPRADKEVNLSHAVFDTMMQAHVEGSARLSALTFQCEKSTLTSGAFSTSGAASSKPKALWMLGANERRHLLHLGLSLAEVDAFVKVVFVRSLGCAEPVVTVKEGSKEAVGALVAALDAAVDEGAPSRSFIEKLLAAGAAIDETVRRHRVVVVLAARLPGQGDGPGVQDPQGGVAVLHALRHGRKKQGLWDPLRDDDRQGGGSEDRGRRGLDGGAAPSGMHILWGCACMQQLKAERCLESYLNSLEK